MADKIQIKRSSVEGKKPTPDQLAEGELALNLKDKKIYAKDSDGAVQEFPAVEAVDVGVEKVNNLTGEITIKGSDNIDVDTSGQNITLNTTSNVALKSDLPSELNLTAGDGIKINGSYPDLEVENEVTKIDDLSDVDTTTNIPQDGAVLVFNGANWVPGEGGSSDVENLPDLGDVEFPSNPTQGQVLQYTDGKWQNVDVDAAEGRTTINTIGGAVTIKGTSPITVASPTPNNDNEIIVGYSGTQGIPDAPNDGNQYARQNQAWTQVQATGGGKETLSELTDTDISTRSDDQFLRWDGDNATGKWKNETVSLAPSDAQKNVQSDWDAVDGDAFIKNKPDLAPKDAEKNVQSDWTEADATKDEFINNKPTKLSQFEDDLGYTDTDTGIVKLTHGGSSVTGGSEREVTFKSSDASVLFALNDDNEIDFTVPLAGLNIKGVVQYAQPQTQANGKITVNGTEYEVLWDPNTYLDEAQSGVAGAALGDLWIVQYQGDANDEGTEADGNGYVYSLDESGNPEWSLVGPIQGPPGQDGSSFLPISSTDNKVTLSDDDGTFQIETGDPTADPSTKAARVYVTDKGLGVFRASPDYPIDAAMKDSRGVRLGNQSGVTNGMTITTSDSTGWRFALNHDIPDDGSVGFVYQKGNVGIGTYSAGPEERLHVVGNAEVTGQVQTDTITTKDATSQVPAQGNPGEEGYVPEVPADAKIAFSGQATNIYANDVATFQVVEKKAVANFQFIGGGSIHQYAAAPDYAFAGANDSGMFVAGTTGNHDVCFSTNSVERLRISADDIKAQDGYEPQTDNSLVTKKYVTNTDGGIGTLPISNDDETIQLDDLTNPLWTNAFNIDIGDSNDNRKTVLRAVRPSDSEIPGGVGRQNINVFGNDNYADYDIEPSQVGIAFQGPYVESNPNARDFLASLTVEQSRGDGYRDSDFVFYVNKSGASTQNMVEVGRITRTGDAKFTGSVQVTTDSSTCGIFTSSTRSAQVKCVSASGTAWHGINNGFWVVDYYPTGTTTYTEGLRLDLDDGRVTSKGGIGTDTITTKDAASNEVEMLLGTDLQVKVGTSKEYGLRVRSDGNVAVGGAGGGTSRFSIQGSVGGDAVYGANAIPNFSHVGSISTATVFQASPSFSSDTTQAYLYANAKLTTTNKVQKLTAFNFTIDYNDPNAKEATDENRAFFTNLRKADGKDNWSIYASGDAPSYFAGAVRNPAGYDPQTDDSLVTKKWVKDNTGSGGFPIESQTQKRVKFTANDTDGTCQFVASCTLTTPDPDKSVIDNPVMEWVLGSEWAMRLTQQGVLEITPDELFAYGKQGFRNTSFYPDKREAQLFDVNNNAVVKWDEANYHFFGLDNPLDGSNPSAGNCVNLTSQGTCKDFSLFTIREGGIDGAIHITTSAAYTPIDDYDIVTKKYFDDNRVPLPNPDVPIPPVGVGAGYTWDQLERTPGLYLSGVYGINGIYSIIGFSDMQAGAVSDGINMDLKCYWSTDGRTWTEGFVGGNWVAANSSDSLYALPTPNNKYGKFCDGTQVIFTGNAFTSTGKTWQGFDCDRQGKRTTDNFIGEGVPFYWDSGIEVDQAVDPSTGQYPGTTWPEGACWITSRTYAIEDLEDDDISAGALVATNNNAPTTKTDVQLTNLGDVICPKVFFSLNGNDTYYFNSKRIYKPLQSEAVIKAASKTDPLTTYFDQLSSVEEYADACCSPDGKVALTLDSSDNQFYWWVHKRTTLTVPSGLWQETGLCCAYDRSRGYFAAATGDMVRVYEAPATSGTFAYGGRLIHTYTIPNAAEWTHLSIAGGVYILMSKSGAIARLDTNNPLNDTFEMIGAASPAVFSANPVLAGTNGRFLITGGEDVGGLPDFGKGYGYKASDLPPAGPPSDPQQYAWSGGDNDPGAGTTTEGVELTDPVDTGAGSGGNRSTRKLLTTQKDANEYFAEEIAKRAVVVTLTQAEYDAIPADEIDDNTLYLIT